jgi:hypothetical protein
MQNIYQKITEKTKKNLSQYFEIKGEKFRTFIDDDNDFCLTHYGKDGQNAWCVGNAKGLKYLVDSLTQ